MENKLNRTQLSMFTVLLFLAVIFSFGIGTVAADQSQIYADPTGNDSWDGQYTTWQNNTFGPKLTIKNATGTVATNGIVYVANGTYNENSITINRNMSIIGESKENTIINGTNTARIFAISSAGITVTFANLTFANGNASGYGGAIASDSTYETPNKLTIKNCIFKDNRASSNGGAIFIAGQNMNPAYLTISDSMFINNRANQGGAISNALDTLTITNSDFISNSAGPRGGAIYNNYGTVTAQFSRFIGNTATNGTAIFSDNGGNVQYNWWGSNTGPAAGSVSSPSITTSSWLVLTAPTGITISPNNSSLIIGDLQHDSNGVYHDPTTEGHVPDGIPVTFAGDALGSISPLSGVTINGLILANFTAGSTLGVSHPTFTVDSSGPIAGDVNVAIVFPTELVVDPVSGYNNDWMDLTATLTNTLNNQPVSDAIVDFYVNGAYAGSGLTDTSGFAIVPYNIIQGAGIYQILAQFMGNDTYSASISTNNLTVGLLPTNITANGPVDTNYMDVVNLTATLTDEFSNPLYDKMVYFNVNGNAAGAAKTNGLGVATLSYQLPSGATLYQLIARFLGDDIYTGSNNSTSFNIVSSPTSLTVAPATGYYNNTVVLTANLTDIVHNIPISGKTITFTVNGSPVGNATTVANGIATLSTYKPLLTQGVYEFLAQFAGTTGYISSNGTNNLTINLTPTYYYPASNTFYVNYNNTVNLTTRLRDNNPSYNYLNGKPVSFTVNGTTFNTVTNKISGWDGTATIPYTALLTPGTYQVLIQFAGDGMYNASNVTYNLVVNYNPTKLNATAKSGYFMDTINLTATLKDTPNNLVSGRTVNFSVNGTPVGSAVTDATGVATLPYTVTQGAGIYTIFAQFLAEGGYNASNSTANLTVISAPSSILVDPLTAYHGDVVNLTAILTDTLHGVPISNKTVNFSVNGSSAGSAVTDASGKATLINYLISQNVGLYTILAQFLGDNTYTASNGTNTLNVNYIPTMLIFNPILGIEGSLVNLTTTLTDLHNNIPLSGQNINFSVNGNAIGSSVTNSSGVAILEFTLSPGTYIAQFMGNTIYSSSTAATVPSIINQTQISFNSVSGVNGQLVNLIAILTDKLSNPLSGKYIGFSVNGSSVGYALTNASGAATLPYTIALTVGTYPILAQFGGDLAYASSNNSTNLTVLNNIAPTVVAIPPGGTYEVQQNVTLVTVSPYSTAITYYTTDGSDPTTSSPVYTSPIAINSNILLKFFAIDLDNNTSPIYSETYNILQKPQITPDGRYIVYQSAATNLVPGVNNGYLNIFVKDNITGQLFWISRGIAGLQTNGNSYNPQITPNGRYITFESDATNLVPNDTNGFKDIFVVDGWYMNTILISGIGGPAANGNSYNPQITPNGRYITFESDATNLVPNDTNGFKDIFVVDGWYMNTILISGIGGPAANGNSYNPQITPNGRYITFESDATNLVPNDTNGFKDIFVVDGWYMNTILISGIGGPAANGNSYNPQITPNGRYITFESDATNLVPNDTNGFKDIFVVDGWNSKTVKISGLDGIQSNGNSYKPQLTPDGRYFTFESDATNLVPNDTNGFKDIFVVDGWNSKTVKISGIGGPAANGNSYNPQITPNGRYINFQSNATNLVPNYNSSFRGYFETDGWNSKTVEEVLT